MNPALLRWAMLGLLTCLGVSLCAQEAAPTVVLPLERTAYFIGEDVPIAVAPAQRAAQLSLVDAAGRTAVVSTPGGSGLWRLATARLAPGSYDVLLGGRSTGVRLSLTSPLRASCAAMMDETLPNTATLAQRERVTRILRETGMNAFMATGENEPGQCKALDLFAPTQTMVFFNPYTRPMSFNPARVYAPELHAFRLRLALNAQANGRYPTFGGYYYDWDPTGPFGRQGLLIYWQWGDQTQALRNYIQRADQAVFAQFTQRTGLQPVSEAEYIQYCLAIGRPDFAPAFDLPTVHWLQDIARTMPPLSPENKAALEKRLDAWSQYLMGIYGENYAGHNAVLREIMPSLKNTASVNADHCAVRNGQWHPAANLPLDFHFMTAWNDQIAGPDYTFQWLFSAGLLDITRRADQPTWIASSLGTAHNLANYPGKYLRMAGQNLAYGGRGLGFALEGFSNILGGMNQATNWENIKGKSGEQDLIAGRDFLNRFAPLSAAAADVRRVGVLYSQWQLGRQHLGLGMDTPPYNTFITLARLGYTPRFITEEQILASGLRGMTTLVVTNQTVPLPAEMLAQLRAFTAAGGRLIRDTQTTIELPNAREMNVTMPFTVTGKPHNWGSPNITDVPHAVLNEQRFAELAPAMLTALGHDGRSVLMAASPVTSKVSTFQLDGGVDASYVVAVDDAIVDNQSNWVRTSDTLQPNGITRGAIYDLTTEQALGAVAPILCRFDDLTARLYGVLARPVATIDLKATQTVVAGEELRLQVRFLDAQGKPLQAAIPFTLTIASPTATAQTLYRATDRAGRFTLAWQVPVNEPSGRWTVSVHSALDGRTTTLPVTVRAGTPLQLTAITDPVIVRGGRQIEQHLTRKPAVVVPIFDSPLAAQVWPAAQAVREVLSRRGCAVDIWEHPAMTTYTMGYDPDAAALAENARAENGAAIGRINVTTVNRNDYFGAIGGFIYGKPLVLLDLVAQRDPADARGSKEISDNPLAEQLHAQGLLWPPASAIFPGPGRATVQLVNSAFQLGVDTIVIQASDPEGLLAGARSLAHLPADWLTPSVEGARTKLLQQFTIGAAPAQPVSTRGLTANGLTTRMHPQPLALAFPEGKPISMAEWKPFTPAPLPVSSLPATLGAKELIPYYRVGDRYVRCSTPGGDWPGDCRFQDAVLVKVNAGQGGPCAITLDGTFRYSDRNPGSQSTWESILAMYNAIPKQRLPVLFEVRVDGQPVGNLTTVTTGNTDVLANNVSANGKPIYVHEEVVTSVTGAIPLPAGVHEVLLIHQNIVDGSITTINLAQ